METKEGLTRALRQEAERAVLTLVKQLEEVEEGDLKGLEGQILEMVYGLGRKVMECVLSRTGQEEPAKARREGSCGHQQRLVGQRPKEVLTLLGKVRMHRPYYQCLLKAGEQSTCSHGEAPTDALWGVRQRRTTAGVQEAVGYLAARLTLEETAATFSRLLPLAISARQVLCLIQPVGEALQEQEEKQVTTLFQQAAHRCSGRGEKRQATSIKRLYVELDGVMARLRRGSVEMEAKEQKRPGDVYREVKVGAVFEASAGPHRSKLAPGVFVDQADLQKHYVARRTTAQEFGPLLYRLAVAQGLLRATEVVVLGDGALWIWRLADEHFPKAVQIVDVWHGCEHVWKVAKAVFGPGTPQATAWAEPACTLLVEGKIEDLVAAIAVLPAVPPVPDATRSVPEIEMDYFTTNASRMRYPTFRAQGMHIGSGIAEAACKTVVGTRAKRSGMRWTPKGLDALLALRTAVLNDTYDDFWKAHPRLVA